MSRPSDFLTFSSLPSSSSPPSRAPPSSSSTLTRSPLPPPRSALLLTDTLDAPAQFALVQFIQRALRPAATGGGVGGKGEQRKVVVVGAGEREEFWARVVRKTGIQLPAESSAGRFTYVDATSPSVPLTEIYSSLLDVFSSSSSSSSPAPETNGAGPIVIIDDLSALVWRGEEVREVVRWWKAVRSAVDAAHASLITLLHGDSLSPSLPHIPSSVSRFSSSSSAAFSDPEDQYVFRQVLARSEVWMEVTGLVTGGGAGGTRGEITIHRGPALLDDEGYAVDPSPPLQYKLEDNGAVFEVKGLGRFL
ncbi:hypothetical protein JCM8547_008243 [Rhodosporidiobolus lusitaniae]